MTQNTSVLMWAFALSLYLSVSNCYFSIPLKIYTGNYNVSSNVDLVALRRVSVTADGKGLSLASDPTGTVNFLDMVNNLQGDSGRGYYLEMSVGTPGQKVKEFLIVFVHVCFKSRLSLFMVLTRIKLNMLYPIFLFSVLYLLLAACQEGLVCPVGPQMPVF